MGLVSTVTCREYPILKKIHTIKSMNKFRKMLNGASGVLAKETLYIKDTLKLIQFMFIKYEK
jgi:hypothetical protein